MSSLTAIRDAFLKAMDTPAAERDAVLAALDPPLRSEVIALLSAHESAGDFLSRPGLPEDFAPPGTPIGPYRVVETIGQGGMGVVYRACRADGEFDRDVAIKFVGGRMFAPEAERRFIAERRILALLDHPNIVHMIDGGVWQSQRYLVMEWVAGEPVTKYCAHLPVTRKLSLFRDVCAAIQYAHQHLILHRDIKASNILVTASGQVKVLDFGIAQLVGTESAETTMLHPMSLSCASPEQLRGEPLTLASDVYALGLLLHELLTGANPQATGTPSQIRQRIEDGEFPAPSKLDPKVAPDLDAIVLKALALDPERRYGSAAEMSADVGRYLAARPVAARPPSRLYHATRFVVRNRALTATAVALLLAILTGAATALWQAHRAEQNRLLAERRFAEARRLVYTVIHDIQPQMANINGTLPLRVELIEKTLAYLEALRKDASDNPALMGELIDGYVELAGVSGGVGQANIGDPKRARSMLDKALALGDQLKRAASLSPEAMETLANLYRAIAAHQSDYGTKDMAVQAARQGMEMSQRLAQARPADPRAQESLAKSAWTLANMSSSPDEKIALYERAAAIWTSQTDPAHRYRVALVYRNLSSAWNGKDDYRQALEWGIKARDVDEILLRENPASPIAQLAVAFDLGTIGTAYFDLDQFGPSADNWRKSVELRDNVLASNPQDYRAAERVCFALHDLAQSEMLQSDRKSARVHFERAIGIYERLSKSAPLHKQSIQTYASSCRYLGLLERETGNRALACRLLGRAVDLAAQYEKGLAEIDEDIRERLAKIRSDAAQCQP